MSESRKSLKGKSPQDRVRYFETLKPAPTIPEEATREGSSSTLSTSPDLGGNSGERPKDWGNRIKYYIAEYWFQALQLLIFPILGFLYLQIFGINREIGEVKRDLEFLSPAATIAAISEFRTKIDILWSRYQLDTSVQAQAPTPAPTPAQKSHPSKKERAQ